MAGHGLVLGDSILEFFTQINGGVIQWRLNPKAAGTMELRKPSDMESIQGRAYFFTLDELAPEWPHLRNTPFDEGMEDKNRLHTFRPFDKNVEEAFAGFVVEEGTLVDEMVYMRQYEDLVRLDVDLTGYLRALVQAKAFLWWQDVFAARPGGQATQDLYYYVPRLFKGTTLDLFQ